MMARIAAIESLVADRDRDAFLSDIALPHALALHFLVLGETANRLSEPFRAALPQIEWRKIVNLRHLIAHEYRRIDHAELWRLSLTHIPRAEVSFAVATPPLRNLLMLLPFFTTLRDAKVPVSMKEWLHLMEAMDRDVAGREVESFYHLSRAVLVKDEKHYDRFDQVFGTVFKGVEMVGAGEDLTTDIPEDWLRLLNEKYLTDEEKAQIEALGGFDKLMETLKERLEEQKERHSGGSKWIGTGGTSPFGHGGYNPEGVRIGGPGKHGRAVKVWEKREFRNLDDTVELGTRNIKSPCAVCAVSRGKGRPMNWTSTALSTARRARAG